MRLSDTSLALLGETETGLFFRLSVAYAAVDDDFIF